jgi:hypothetical protein
MQFQVLFGQFISSSCWVGGGIHAGSDCHRHPTVITPILHFWRFVTLFRADCNYSLVGGTGLQSSRFDGVGVEAELFLGDFIEVVFGIVL